MKTIEAKMKNVKGCAESLVRMCEDFAASKDLLTLEVELASTISELSEILACAQNRVQDEAQGKAV